MHSDKAVLNKKDINQTDSISAVAIDADSTTAIQTGLPTSREDCIKLDGNIFRYKGDGLPDSVRHTIIFRCGNDSLKALMFGPDPEGEHGMFYFKTDLDDLRVNGSLITFSMTMRELYHKPYTLNNYDKGVKYEVQGGSNGIQLFKGKLAGDSIVFTCDPDGDCYDRVMVFKKINR